MPEQRLAPGDRITAKYRNDTGPVERAILGRLDASQFAHGRQQIERTDGFCNSPAGGDLIGIAQNAWHANPAVVDMQLHPAQRSSRAIGAVGRFVSVESFGAIV